MNPIQERIKKLLRLARSDNQAEAQLAMQRAFQLAQKHKLAIEELDLEKDLEAIAERAFKVGQRISFEHKQAAVIIQDYFNCHCVLSRPHVLIFGTDSDIVIAEYVIEFLVWSVRSGLARYKTAEKAARRKWSNNKRASYIRGFYYALHSKLGETRGQLPEASETAIVLHANRLQDHVAKRFGKGLVKSRMPKARRLSTAMESGWDKGKQTHIRQPITGQPRAAIS